MPNLETCLPCPFPFSFLMLKVEMPFLLIAALQPNTTLSLAHLKKFALSILPALDFKLSFSSGSFPLASKQIKFLLNEDLPWSHGPFRPFAWKIGILTDHITFISSLLIVLQPLQPGLHPMAHRTLTCQGCQRLRYGDRSLSLFQTLTLRTLPSWKLTFLSGRIFSGFFSLSRLISSRSSDGGGFLSSPFPRPFLKRVHLWCFTPFPLLYCLSLGDPVNVITISMLILLRSPVFWALLRFAETIWQFHTFLKITVAQKHLLLCLFLF